VISGTVTAEGVPVITLQVAGQDWTAILDTGFNGDLELPAAMRTLVNARFSCQTLSLLASGQRIVEDIYLVDFPFDGQTIIAEATFSSGGEILIGTHLMRDYRLEIDFPHRMVRLEHSP
jgi:predicted aspartyl protease